VSGCRDRALPRNSKRPSVSHHWLSDALANASGRRPAGEFRRSHFRYFLSLGYELESAFSTAFKRVMGCSPRQYSRGRNLASVSP
jgi:hypothetical protein